jgi:hypothetical protein
MNIRITSLARTEIVSDIVKLAFLRARIVVWIVIFESARADRRHLRYVLARLHPTEVPISPGRTMTLPVGWACTPSGTLTPIT